MTRYFEWQSYLLSAAIVAGSLFLPPLTLAEMGHPNAVLFLGSAVFDGVIAALLVMLICAAPHVRNGSDAGLLVGILVGGGIVIYVLMGLVGVYNVSLNTAMISDPHGGNVLLAGPVLFLFTAQIATFIAGRLIGKDPGTGLLPTFFYVIPSIWLALRPGFIANAQSMGLALGTIVAVAVLVLMGRFLDKKIQAAA